MISTRFINLIGIYIILHFFSKMELEESSLSIFYNEQFLVAVSTYLYFLWIKYHENNECLNPKLIKPISIYTEPVVYAIFAIIAQYIYKFLLEKDCTEIVSVLVNNIDNFTYIPEAIFVAGFVLLTNSLRYLIYPKCN